jgi:hypothetical protein
MPNKTYGLFRTALGIKDRDAQKALDQLEQERQSFDPALGEFDMMERARQLGLTVNTQRFRKCKII